MKRAVGTFVREHLEDHRGFVVGLSGGSDSLALTLLAKEACDELGKELVAAHVHHGLRDDADYDLAFCRQFCAEQGITFESVRIKVKTRNSVMHQARAQRYAALSLVAAQFGFDVVLTAHHADDDAENQWLAKHRGSMSFEVARYERFQTMGIFVGRPLLGIRRDDLRQFLTDQHIGWVEDPSNADPKYARTHAREAIKSGIQSESLTVAALEATRLNRDTVTLECSQQHSPKQVMQALTRESRSAVLGKKHTHYIEQCQQGPAGPFAVQRGVLWSSEEDIFLERTYGQGLKNWGRVAHPVLLRSGEYPWFGGHLRVSADPFEGATPIPGGATHIQGCSPGLRDQGRKKVSERLRSHGISVRDRWRWPCAVSDSCCVAIIGHHSTVVNPAWWAKYQEN